jgi:TolB-like protein/Flp pilus assembly protein TadD
MATGTAPFKGSTTAVIFNEILSKAPVAPVRLNPELPDQLEGTINKALEKDREIRCQTSKELLLDLKRLKRDTSGESVSAAVPAATPAKRSYFWPLVAGGLVVAVLLLLALLLPFASAPTEAIDSIAILPFENRSGDPELEYVSDGIAQGLTNRLSQLSSLNKVISSSSLSRYKGQGVDAKTVAQETDVRSVVTGRMDSLGEYIRISVELLDGENNNTLWGESYNRPRSQLYELEEYISEEIADALGIQLTTEQGEHLTQRNTENSEAHDAYLQGQHYLLIGTKEAGEKAIEYFEQAIEQDPDYALGYAGLSDAHRAMNNEYLPPWETMPPAREAAIEALRLDDTLAEAHTSLANVRFLYDYDWVQTEAEFKRALELNPSLPEAHDGYALYLALMLREEEAIREMQRAKELDPFSPRFDANMVRVLFLARHYDQAIEHGLRVINTHPNFPLGHRFLGFAYSAIEQFDEATVHMSRAVELDPNPPNVALLGQMYALSGAHSKADEMLNELEKLKDQGLYYCPYERALVYIALGDTDEAFDLLGQAYDERAYCMPFLQADPFVDTLRDDPRFQDLLRRMNLEP